MIEDNKITGLMINYYFICKRKLWFSCNSIDMEQENESVSIGKHIDENTYTRDRKHLLINGVINIDYIKSNGTIHEIKKSRKIEDAAIWQVKYYLYYLELYGIRGIEAKINYPLLKEVVDVTLDEKDKVRIAEIISNIKTILSNDEIPKIELSKKCNRCAYYDMCMI